MQDFNKSLAVIGAGSYGTALAISVASKNIDVCLYSHNEKKATQMQEERENSFYLPKIKFPKSLNVVSDLKATVLFSHTILIVVPSHAFKDILIKISPFLSTNHRIIWATKGLDNTSGKLLSSLVKEIIPFEIKFAAISGPTFAKELALGMPTAIAVAGNNSDFCKEVCELFHSHTFRLYESNDLIALQIGGAVKNVIAIAAGMSDGLGFGANARTALITRGLAEIVRLGIAMGATETGFMGLSGFGDLVLTCTDNQSRNRRFGNLLGKNTSVDDALKIIGQVVEGYLMVPVVHKLAKKFNVDMPICTELYEVIFNGKSGKEAAKSLLGRAQTKE